MNHNPNPQQTQRLYCPKCGRDITNGRECGCDGNCGCNGRCGCSHEKKATR